MIDGPEVTILGAGIAGLACALACARTGRSVQVLEQAPALTEIGAGLQIAPNGGRVLNALGVRPRALESEAVHLIDGRTGRRLIRMPLGPGFRLVHRADLIAALAEAVRAAGIPVLTGIHVEAVEAASLHRGGGITVPFRRLVGADGARGPSRTFVAPDHAARFTGQVAWRAIVPVEDWPREAQIHVGPGRHLVCYPLRDGRSLNIVAVEERAEWTAAGWSQPDDPGRLRAAFADYADPIRQVLDRVEQVHVWGLMDHGLTPRWSRGPVTLIGDAAHPTLPFLAQGANLALEDAWTLAQGLDDPERWEAGRRPRVARALDAAKANAANYHLSGIKARAAHAALRLADRVRPQAMAARYAWLYEHDVTGG
ncbi:FAD-dependent monooxygenase [Jannaschia ovalis]|uniref:FAD-dependent monooxygenase n=1 Tax=Jannaschia ovalis TaxID=3038773 RepID=A0ABY8L9F6_9RHOB|nr:FAD-dependent monooxygenase [Jannaschia sp. GRR-S6-38]WGH77982.1 FAD-dependent monooxygenase [Jannaschia sp. GRR-S6-38]